MIAVVLLVALAVAFGVVGTAAPPPVEETAPVEPQQESPELGHFQNPPTYDSGWLDITDKCGQYFNITHDLNSSDVMIDIMGRTTLDGGSHQRCWGTTGCVGWLRDYFEISGGIWTSLIQDYDGGFLMAGDTMRWEAGQANGALAMVVKTDAFGNIQRTSTYGTPYETELNSIARTRDNGFVVAGRNCSDGVADWDFYLAKVDAGEMFCWEKSYAGTGDEVAYAVAQTSDDGFILSGTADRELFLLKTDADGVMQWNRTYSGTAPTAIYFGSMGFPAFQTSDGGYMLGCTTDTYGAGSNDFWLAKTDATGVIQWMKTYGGPGSERLTGMCHTRDDGYVMCGELWEAGTLLVKTDAEGNEAWEKTYADQGACLIIQIQGDGFLLAGRDSLFATDAFGNLLWNRTYTSPVWWGGRGLTSAIQTKDNGYALAGVLSMQDDACPCLVSTGFEHGLAWTDSTPDTITLYRGTTDPHWNFVQVRVWTIEEPTWIYGDINQDGVVDARDLYILSRNYGKIFSVASLGGLAAIAGIHTYKKRKQQNS